MKTRHLGNSSFELSEVGLGCWQLGSDWRANLDNEQAFAIMSAAVENGVTFFDTADVYGDGRSESLIGQFNAQCSTPLRIATKFGRMPNVYPNQYTEDALKKAIDASRERLQVESIDLLQLHCIPEPVMRQGDIFEWLRKAKQEGSIRAFGASVETVDEGLLCIEQDELQSLQVIFNIVRQKLVKALLPQAQDKGVGIIARLPLASGLLTGNFTKQTHFAESDHRHYNRDGQAFNVGETFAGLPFEQGVELINELQNALPEGITMLELALRWILDHDAVSTIIPGASTPSQAAGNASVSKLEPLPQALHERVSQFYHERVHAHIRGAY